MKVHSLSDFEIKRLTQNKIVTNGGDVSLKGNSCRSVKGGLFDESIFGGLYKCKCGKSQVIGDYCTECRTKVLDKKSYSISIARYELPIPIISHFKLSILKNRLISQGIKLKSKESITTLWNREFIFLEDSDGTLSKGGKKYSLEFQTVNEDSDYYVCGTLGLKKLSEFDGFSWINNYINQYLIVSSPYSRPYNLLKIEGKPTLFVDSQNGRYRTIFVSCDIIYEIIQNKDFNFPVLDRLTLYCNLNLLIESFYNENPILLPSKESSLRNLVGTRVRQSGRANIIPDTSITVEEVKLPFDLAYRSLQKEILDGLVEKYRDNSLSNSFISLLELYEKKSPDSLEVFNSIVENSRVLIIRQPSLHRYNTLTFKPIIWDNLCIGIPLPICGAYNADFDGDQILFKFILDKELSNKSLHQMSAKSLWRYEKNGDFLFTPNHEILLGYNILSRDIDGRESVSKILGESLDKILGKDRLIDSDSINLIMEYLEDNPKRSLLLRDLNLIALEAVTLEGIDSLPLTHLFKEFSITTNKSLPETFEDISSQIKKDILQNIENIPKSNLSVIMKGNDRIKYDSLKEIYSPQLRVTKTEGIKRSERLLLEGFTESDMIISSSLNREILTLKQDLIPRGGYNQRQLVINNIFLEFEDTLSPDTTGILVTKDFIQGREIIRQEGDLYYIKSCVTNGIKHRVFNNELRKGYFNQVRGSSIGMSFASAITERMTQKALGFKHGGQLITYRDESLKFLGDGGVVEEITPNFIRISDNTYLLSKDCVLSSSIKIGGELLKEDIIAMSKILFSASQMLDKFNSSVLTNTVGQKKGVSLETRTINFSPKSGVISYIDNKLLIDGEFITDILPNLIYFYPEGYNINYGDKLSTGILNPVLAEERFGISIASFLFHLNLLDVLGGLSLETSESLYKCINENDPDKKTVVFGQDNLPNPYVKLYQGRGRENLGNTLKIELGESYTPSPIEKLLSIGGS